MTWIAHINAPLAELMILLQKDDPGSLGSATYMLNIILGHYREVKSRWPADAPDLATQVLALFAVSQSN